MKWKRIRSAPLFASVIVGAGCCWLTVPLAFGSSAPAGKAEGPKTSDQLRPPDQVRPAGGSSRCRPAGRLSPRFPLEMNTIVAGTGVKTVLMEKEVFRCTRGRERFVRDVETFIEILQDQIELQFETLERRIEVVTCDKPVANPSKVSCSSRPVRLVEEPVSLRRCTAPVRSHQPKDPVEMNTVTVLPLAKTIKVDKEVFACGRRLADVYVFTEIVEVRRAPSPEQVPRFVPGYTAFDGIVCLKSVTSGRIVQCHHFTPA